MEEIFKFYKLLSIYISIIPLSVGLVRIKKLNSAFLFLLIMIACETGVAIYSRWQQVNGINNLPSLHLMTFLEILFGGFFFFFILEIKKQRRILFGLTASLLVYTFINSVFLQSIYNYNHIPRTIEGSLFVLSSFFFFYELLKQPDLIQLSKSAKFWAVIAFFTYFGTTQFVHLFSEYMMEYHNSFHKALRELNRAMVIIYYSIFTVALLMENKRNSFHNTSIMTSNQ